MADRDLIMPVEPADALPIVQTITFEDLKTALRKGFDDYWAMPTHVLFLIAVYPVAGLLIGRAAFGYDLVPLLYPMAAGLALLGPFAAVGLYELSRRRETGLDSSWKHMFDVVHSPSLKSILALGAMLLVLFLVWIAIAHAIYVSSFGWAEPDDPAKFLRDVLTTPQGHRLITVGNFVGFLFALAAFAISVVSFPLLLDRHVSVATAILTSVATVVRNPLVMAAWAAIIAVGLLLGALPLLMGLAVVFPILGHATWHLYRAAIKPDDGVRPQYAPKPKGKRYGAEFPAALFTRNRIEPE